MNTKHTNEQQEEYNRLRDAAEAQLDQIVEQYEEHTPRSQQIPTDQRLKLNEAAEAYCRSEIEEAELRGRITEAEAEALRDEVHTMAADRQPGTNDEDRDRLNVLRANRKNKAKAEQERKDRVNAMLTRAGKTLS